MSRGINKVILIGNITKDPETRYMPSGEAVTSFGVATNEEWKAKDTGEKKSRAEFHNITMFGKLAEIADKYLTKGSQVYLEGSIRTEKYQDKQGNDRYSTKIIANQMQMLGGKSDGQQNQSQSQPQSQPSQDDDFNDSIPF